ncbi:trypsin-4-like [Eupeodes corollae]|uniref:trypsin-4-like n=1 Tax=Eupeodes corollae TaxID=290404 RepID=UPI00248FB351|nr:trypsin-4-like [Eupeodes corollae]
MEFFPVLLIVILASLATGTDIDVIGRIVGGYVVDIGSYPYMVSVRSNDRHICGGSIIAPDTILTAAHCTNGRPVSQFTIRCGSDSADLGRVHQVYQIQQHYYYDPQTTNYDVAKLKIIPPIAYSRNSQPIRLSTQRPAENALLVVSGWGRLWQGMKPTSEARQHLRAVYVRAMNQNECFQKYKSKEVTSTMLCAASPGKDSCQGDSGGPLVDARTGEQYGIASWGSGCANPNYPGVYSSVPDLLDFIKS